MKITIDKNITIGDAPHARKILKDFKFGDYMASLAPEELKRAAEFYLNTQGDNATVYEVSANISYHSGGEDILGDYDVLRQRYPIDIYITLFARSYDVCGEIGFYLTDFWKLAGDSTDYLREKAYRNLYKRID